ncbi:MAG: diguanylate cyclase [Candidatus Acinetobacter avistercoris]|uniref:sensor domain-containing diguanylate cyclase n=1 Tax=Acinetobacter sp. KS-LM10 TaxID=3120518 RepID=UPI001F86E25C|nr:diguanylate cyclase [Candidatus Acinetobacter avistercoris]
MNSSEDAGRLKSNDSFLELVQNIDKRSFVSTFSKFPVPIAIINIEAVFLGVNQCFADIYESDAMYMMGKKLNEFSTVVYAHFLSAISSFQDDLYLNDIENEFYSKGHFYLAYFRALRDVDRKIYSIVVVGADITKLKRRERVLIQNNKKLHEYAYIDQVTGLKSKLALELFISEKFVGDESEVYAFIKIDINDFKKFNQMNSYNIGDQTLTRIGQEFSEEILQDKAEIYRLNSASFVVVVEDSTPWKVLTIAERLRQKMIKSEIVFHSESDEKLTVTIGIYHPKMYDPMTGSDILRELDVAVRNAKNQGQNSIYVLD